MLTVELRKLIMINMLMTHNFILYCYGKDDMTRL